MSMRKVRSQRKEAAQRKRRIIHDQDGDDAVYMCDEATPEALLKARTSALADTQVDTLSCCTWSSGFGLFTHRTTVGEVFSTRESVFHKNVTADLHALNTDPLEIKAGFCREHGLEMWWGLRVNDYHDGAWQTYPQMFPRFKAEHPEYLVGAKDRPARAIGDGRAWSAVDFNHEQVRDKFLGFIREVCENYDIDGVCIDFFRHLVFFASHAMDGAAYPSERDLMTETMRAVRKMADAQAEQTGKPILLAVRVPDSPGYCEQIGLDITRWMKEDLIDLLLVSGYFQLSPWSESVALGHRFEIPVYPVLSESRMKEDVTEIRNTSRVYRGRASNVWAAGADGVALFNFGLLPPEHSLLHEVGSLETLRGLDKTYFGAVRGFWGVNAYLPEGERYLSLPTLCPERPLALPPGATQSAVLPIYDDAFGSDAPAAAPQVTVHLQLDPEPQPRQFSVSVNGHPADSGSWEKGFWTLTPPAEHLVKGDNTIAFVSSGAPDLTVRDLYVEVDHPS